MRVNLVAALLTALLGAPAAQAQTLTIDDSFQFGETRWTNGAKMEIAWRPVNTADGGWAICGAWAISDILVRPGARNMLRDATVEVDGAQVHRNLTRFKRGRFRGGLVGQEAQCIAIDSPQATVSLNIRMGDGSFRN